MGWRRPLNLVRERLGLLGLLRVVPAPVMVGLTLAMLVASLLPAATAVAVAWLVGRVIDATQQDSGLSDVVWPLVIVGALLTLDQVTQSLLVPFRNWVAARVNGEVRRTIRQAVSVRPGIDHLESQVVRDAAALPVENAYLFNMGAGAEGQLWLMTRFVGAAAAAAVVARYSVLAAVAVFGFVVWQRSILPEVGRLEWRDSPRRTHAINGLLQLVQALRPRTPQLDYMGIVVFWQNPEPTVAIDLFENHIHFIAISIVDRPDSILFHSNRPYIGFWYKGQNV